MSSADDSETSGNGVKKTFKSQSLNSLFRRTVSPEVETTSISTTTSSTGNSTAAALGPTVASAVNTPASISKSPWNSPREKSPALAHATLSKASTGGTVLKLSTIKKDPPPVSPAASPGTDHANIWMKSAAHAKPEEKEKEKQPEPEPKTELKPAKEPEQAGKSQSEAALIHKRTTSEFSEEELEKRGINVLHVPQQSSGFNWDDDDDDDPTWAAAQLSEIAPGVASTLKAAAEAAAKAQAEAQAQAQAQSAAAASQSRSKVTPGKPEIIEAPWSNIATTEPKNFVSIDQQFKELAEKKQAEQARQQQLQQRRQQRMGGGAGGFNRRDEGFDRWGDDPHDRFGRGPSGPGPYHGGGGHNRFDDFEDDRFRFQDHDRRYRSFESPRQELYSPRSRQFEPLDHHGGPHGGGGRRMSMEHGQDRDFRPGPAHGHGPEPVESGSSLNPYGPSMHGHTVVFRQKDKEKDSSNSNNNSQSEKEQPPKPKPKPKQPEVVAPPEPVKTAEQIRQEQKERMHQAAEAARKRKEEELRKEQERIEAARKKADEIAKAIAERKKKEEEAAKQNAKYVVPSRRMSGSHGSDHQATGSASSSSAAFRTRSHTRGSSIDDMQTIKAIDSIINDDSDASRGSKFEKSKKTLWKPAVTTAEPKIWGRSDTGPSNSSSSGPNSNSNTNGHHTSNGLWSNIDNTKSYDGKPATVQVVTRDIDADWKIGKEERLQKFKNTPAPAISGNKRVSSFDSPPGARGHSRFFPSPHLEPSNGPAIDSPVVGRSVGLNSPESLWSLQSSSNDISTTNISDFKTPSKGAKTKVPRVVLPPSSHNNNYNQASTQSQSNQGYDHKDTSSDMPIPVKPMVKPSVRHEQISTNNTSKGSKTDSGKSTTAGYETVDRALKLPLVITTGFTSQSSGIDDKFDEEFVQNRKEMKVKVGSDLGDAPILAKREDITYPIGQVTLPDLTAASGSYYRDSTNYMHRREFEATRRDEMPSYVMIRIANMIKKEISLTSAQSRERERKLGHGTPDGHWRLSGAGPGSGSGPRSGPSRSSGSSGFSFSSRSNGGGMHHGSSTRTRTYGINVPVPQI